MSDEVRQAFIDLREFMFREVYIPEDRRAEGEAAQRIVRLLYRYYDRHRSEIPPEYARRSQNENEAVVDYVSGMTDRYALRMAEKIETGIARIFAERLL